MPGSVAAEASVDSDSELGSVLVDLPASVASVVNLGSPGSAAVELSAGYVAGSAVGIGLGQDLHE